MRRAALVPLLAAVVGLAGCGSDGGSGGSAGTGAEPVRAVAAFYPLEFALARVGGDRVAVEGLTKPGAEPHDLELGARQTARVSDADLLVHLSGFQPAVDEAAETVGDRAFDVASAVELLDGFTELEGEHADEEHAEDEHADEEGHEGEAARGRDPHLWLDPLRLAQVGDALADRLAELDAADADAYEAGAAQLRADLEALDGELRAGLSDCRRRQIVVSHNAFGYLAERYDLQQVGISGLSPDEEPSPARIAEAARYAERNGVTTIFFETLVSPKVAETVADEVGARTAVLDPVEGPPEGGDYFSAMRANLQALRTALDCA